MPSWVWAGGVLIIACSVFVIWRLVVWTKGPRKYFRAGNADPQRHRFAPEERGPLAPQTVEEPSERGVFERTLDEEAALLLEGPRHSETPITTSIDRETERAIEEEARGVSIDDKADVVHRPAGPPGRPGPDDGDGERRRRLAAEEHRKAAEEHRRAAEALAPEKEKGVPADEPADGRVRPPRDRGH